MASTPGGEAELLVGGMLYGGWKSLQVSRGIEQIAGSFEIELTERWYDQIAAWPIAPGEPCQVRLGGTPVITGYVDETSVDLSKDRRSVRITGRDKTGDLVDCSAVYESGQWTNVKLDLLANYLAHPFGIKVIVETDIGTAFPTHSIQQGETAFECLERAARMRGVLLTSNTQGDLVITRAGKSKAPAPIVEGENLLGGHADFNWKDRFSAYTVKGQAPGDGWMYGNGGKLLVNPKVTIADKNVNRYRPLLLLNEGNTETVTAEKRAKWEKNVRIGRSARISAQVQGWRSGGRLWEPNQLVSVNAPSMRANFEMLVVSVTYLLDEQGTRTELSLALPDAFELLEGYTKEGRLSNKLRHKDRAGQDKDTGSFLYGRGSAE